ncbi:efflux RND transporter periplasmic adaptor subunit [Compostibacter hankyongensis]|uniref:Efflux RND transporter periplasmic adaptor subunit n=1 Tax=Compostibacter hankyongensis TaxID=1007089 RepID=A0ABP8FG25_9BACT
MQRLFIISGMALLLAACQSKPGNKQEQLKQLKTQRDALNKQIAALEATVGDSQTVKAIPVSVMALHPSEFRNYIQVQGRVDAEENAGVTPEAPGVITGIFVKAGQHVGKGQVLAQIDDKVVRQQIAQAQSQLDYAKNLYGRQKNLWDQNIGTEVQMLTAKNNYESAQKQVAVLQSQLSTYKIKSPVSGTVDNVTAKIGDAAQPGMVVMRVVNTSDLKVKGEIGESYISKVKNGGPVDIIFPDTQDTLHTRISYAGRVIDQSSRAFNIEIRLPNSNKYHPNMLAVIKVISYTSKDALTIPISVIQHAADGDYVYVADQNKAKRVKITVGQRYNGQAEITSGLKEGDQVITAGFESVGEGNPLEIVNG